MDLPQVFKMLMTWLCKVIVFLAFYNNNNKILKLASQEPCKLTVSYIPINVENTNSFFITVYYFGAFPPLIPENGSCPPRTVCLLFIQSTRRSVNIFKTFLRLQHVQAFVTTKKKNKCNKFTYTSYTFLQRFPLGNFLLNAELRYTCRQAFILTWTMKE